MPVLKKDGSIRICGDYKLTVNQVAKKDAFPLPRIEDIFASLEGGQAFTIYPRPRARVPASTPSRPLPSTHLEASSVFHSESHLHPLYSSGRLRHCLQGIPHCSVYILVTGRSHDEHLRNLDTVLQRLEEAEMRLKRNKCRFMLAKVEYLGHTI